MFLSISVGIAGSIGLRVLVRAFGDLIDIVGRERILDLEAGSKLQDLILRLPQNAHNKRRDRVGHHAVGGGDLVILVNGRSFNSLMKLETPLGEGDIVTLLPPVRGGSVPTENGPGCSEVRTSRRGLGDLRAQLFGSLQSAPDGVRNLSSVPHSLACSRYSLIRQDPSPAIPAMALTKVISWGGTGPLIHSACSRSIGSSTRSAAAV